MIRDANLIHHMKTQQPATWSLLKLAAVRGHVFISDASDRLSLSPDLQREDPRLHFLMVRIMDDWQSGQRRAFRAVTSLRS